MSSSIFSKTAAGIGALALAAVGFIAVAPSASAVDGSSDGPSAAVDDGTGYFLTLVARACQPVGTDPLDSLKNVYANQDRDDIQQTLYQLGGDSQYSGSDDQVRPEKEDAGTQASPNCAPLVGQTFTLGTNGSGPKVSNLSTVTTSATVNRTLTTLATADDYTEAGAANGTIAGAVTIELTADELARANNANLWVQGGTPDQPLADGSQFAALRCGNDYLKGDNVEWVAYKNQGQKHAYCYYFSVAKPADSGTIVIKKVVTGDAPNNPDFTIHGVTFNADETFKLKAGDQESFVRGPGEWTITEDQEDIPSGYSFDKVECKNSEGQSVNDLTEVANGTTFTLAKDETVTCTFTNHYGTKTATPTPTCSSNCGTTPPACTSNCGGGSTPSTPTVVQPTPTPTPTPAVTAEAAAAVGLPAPGVAAPQAAKIPAAKPQAATVPDMGTVPNSVPAGGGSTAPTGVPVWAWLLMAFGAVGGVVATAKMMGARR